MFDVYAFLSILWKMLQLKKKIKAKFVLSSLCHIAYHSLGDKLNDKKLQSMDVIRDILDGY